MSRFNINIDQNMRAHSPPVHFGDEIVETESLSFRKTSYHQGQCSLVLGASSGLGRALATELASRHHDLVLSAGEHRDLLANASDCEIRFGVQVKTFDMDLNEAHFAAAFHAERILSAFPNLQNIFICPASPDPKDIGLSDEQTIRRSNEVHFLNLVLLLSELSKHAEQMALKNILLCSSVLAHTPSSKNISFAASQASLETYCQGLRGLLAAKKILVQTYILGHVDSPFTYGQKLLLPVLPPQFVAKQMLKNLGRNIGQVYLPGYWRVLIFAFGLLPWRLQRLIGG